MNIPDGMLEAADEAIGKARVEQARQLAKRDGELWPNDIERISIEAALRWLSENPIEPTLEQAQYMYDGFSGSHDTTIQYCMTEWQRRMFS